MKAEDLFQQACDAWGIEVATPTHEFQVKRVLMKDGEPLDVTWCPEVAQDLAAFHGEDAAKQLVLVLLERTARSLMGMPLEVSDGNEAA